jgi:hypothetical protein
MYEQGGFAAGFEFLARRSDVEPGRIDAPHDPTAADGLFRHDGAGLHRYRARGTTASDGIE